MIASPCYNCDLCSSRVKIATPRGPSPARLMFIGEFPSYYDDIKGEPFSIDGQSGEELARLCWQNSIDIDSAKIDLLVRCRSHTGKDPKPVNIYACGVNLEKSIRETSPEVIVPLGGVATRHFLGKIDMEMVNGIPYFSKEYDCIIFPIFHPGAGIKKPEIMLKITAAFAYLKLLLKGETNLRDHKNFKGLTLPLHEPDQFAGKEDYTLITDPLQVHQDFYNKPKLCAVDTETVDWRAWCLSYSVKPGQGRVIMKDDYKSLSTLNLYLNNPAILVLLHNALFDLKILAKMNVHPLNFRDTMIMAYLLQSEPQGLKPLAFRLNGMEMEKYEEVVNQQDFNKGIAYFERILSQIWDNPTPYWAFNTAGDYKLVHPQNISKTVIRIIKDYHIPEKDTDIRDRWKKIVGKKGRTYVEDIIGKMPEGTIEDIPLEDAIFYACRDADATLRIYPNLLKKIQSMSLEEVLDIDCSIISMVLDMVTGGMKVLPDYLRTLSGDFQREKDKFTIPLYNLMGKAFNIGSSKQIANLLFDKLKLPQIKKRKTEAKVLMQLKDKHEAVKWIIKWRKYDKLNNTYAEKLPKFADENDRVHPTIKITRTSTGRMAMSKPNLMAQPKKGEESKLIRKGFIARKDCFLVSADYCLVGDTSVTTEYGPVKIQDIPVGIGVLSSLNGEQITMKPVTASSYIGNLPVYKLTTDNGSEVVCTGDHKWMTYKGELKETKFLNPGEKLAHIKTGSNGQNKYPTWYLKTHHNYRTKHSVVAEYKLGPTPKGYQIDHIDGDVTNWNSFNFRHLPEGINKAQGGQKYWEAVKKGERSDDIRLEAVRRGVSNRRSYVGKGNPNYGKYSGENRFCVCCGDEFYAYPSQSWAKKCKPCRGTNHKVKSVTYVGYKDVYQITVEDTHTYALENGLISANSQVELRVLAHEANEPSMIKDFINGEDIHLNTAVRVFRISSEDVTEDQRRSAKIVNFGIPYGVQAQGLREQIAAQGGIGWTYSKCQELINSWYETYPKVYEYMMGIQQFAQRYGYVRDMWGRVRFVPNIKSANKWAQLEALRQAGNMPIQAGAAGIIKKAMANLTPVYKGFQKSGYICDPLIQIHDDLMFEVQEPIVEPFILCLRHHMEGVVHLKVPITVDPEVGKVWSEMQPVDEWLKERR